jgi:hypothetical protein
MKADLEDRDMGEGQHTSSETRDLVNALIGRTEMIAAAKEAFHKAYPDAPQHMIEAAVFHVFSDGVWAALDWVAAAERFLRDPSHGLDNAATCHLLYHLYNWQQFEALLPTGRGGLLDRLNDIKHFLDEGDDKAAREVLKQLEKMFTGDLTPPQIT